MPRSPSPPRGPRRRSPQPRETRDRDRSRSRSPPRGPRKAKELSFYKKSSSSLGSSSQRRDPFDDESARVRMERRDRGEVPARFGGTREQGVRNTMSAVAPVGSSSMGSLKRTADPLDRMRVKGGNERREDGPGDKGGVETGGPRRNGDQAREERVSAMEKTERRPAAQPTPGPVASSGRLIEVIANDRLGRKVRIKCLATDTVGDLKRLIAAQTGTTAQKIQLKKWYTSFKDHVTLQDYEINDGMSLEMY